LPAGFNCRLVNKIVQKGQRELLNGLSAKEQKLKVKKQARFMATLEMGPLLNGLMRSPAATVFGFSTLWSPLPANC
jgi:hypothetical protein